MYAMKRAVGARPCPPQYHKKIYENILVRQASDANGLSSQRCTDIVNVDPPFCGFIIHDQCRTALKDPLLVPQPHWPVLDLPTP